MEQKHAGAYYYFGEGVECVCVCVLCACVSSSELSIRSESQSVQEPHSTVNVALVVTLVSDVFLLWRSMGRIYPDWEEKQYLQHFRVSKDSFKISVHMSIIFLSASESHFAFDLDLMQANSSLLDCVHVVKDACAHMCVRITDVVD